jgi:spermidine/putrescine transport system permease protein
MKRLFGRSTVPLVVLVVAAAIVVPRAMRSRRLPELNLFNWTEYMPQEILDAFAKEFRVKINYDTYSSNEEMLAKLTAGAAGYDIIVPSDYMVSVLLQQDLLEPLDKQALTNWDNLDPNFLNLEFDPSNRYSVPYMWGTVGLAVNTTFVKETITKWGDLWDPKYKGRIVLPDDPREIIGMGLQVTGKSRNSTEPKDLEAAKQKLRDLMPSIKAFDSDSPKSLLLSGEVHLGMVWNGEAVLAAVENPKIIYVLPAEGGGIWMDTLAIPKSAKNKKLAHEFINFMLRPEISARLSEAFPYGNPNKASHALTDPGILSNPAAYPSASALRKAEWLTDVGEATVLYDRIWTELKGQ